jgi:hypothetical protein
MPVAEGEIKLSVLCSGVTFSPEHMTCNLHPYLECDIVPTEL